MKVLLVTEDRSKEHKWAQKIRHALNKYDIDTFDYNFEDELDTYTWDVDKYLFISNSGLNTCVKMVESYFCRNGLCFTKYFPRILIVASRDNLCETESQGHGVNTMLGLREENIVLVRDIDEEFTWWPHACVFLFGKENCIQYKNYAVSVPWFDNSLVSLKFSKELIRSLSELGVKVIGNVGESDICVFVYGQAGGTLLQKKESEVNKSSLLILDYQWNLQTARKEPIYARKRQKYGTSESLDFILRLMVIPKRTIGEKMKAITHMSIATRKSMFPVLFSAGGNVLFIAFLLLLHLMSVMVERDDYKLKYNQCVAKKHLTAHPGFSDILVVEE